MIKKYNENWDDFNSISVDKPRFNYQDIEVVGLPSGQVIYLTNQQVIYFKSRDLVKWINIWKKPKSLGFNLIDIKNYCFEDANFNKIKELLNIIEW